MITPGEIFSDPAIRQSDELRYWGYATPLDTMLASLDQLADHSTLLDIDQLGDGVDSLSYYAATVLGNLPPETVFQHYGEEGLIFVTCHAGFKEVHTKFQDALRDFGGYDKSLFDKAQLWAYQKYHTSGCREVLAQYAVMETVTSGWLDSVDLEAILRDCVRPGVEVSDKRLQDYELLPLCSSDLEYAPAGWERTWVCDIEPEEEGKPIARYSICLDTPTGFALGYKGRPQALAGLECVGQRELMISQFQGVKAKKIHPDKKYDYSDDAVIGRIAARGLAPFDWQRVIVTVAAELAMRLGLESLAIQGGENNVWRKKKLKGETEPHISREVAAKAYDEPAERLGFRRQNDGNWHMSLA